MKLGLPDVKLVGYFIVGILAALLGFIIIVVIFVAQSDAGPGAAVAIGAAASNNIRSAKPATHWQKAAAVPTPAYLTAVENVIDGDTVRVSVSVWVNQMLRTTIRLRGLDTPEINGKCAAEKSKAQEAKAYLQKVIDDAAGVVFLSHVTADKYGNRFDANVFTPDGINIASLLIEKNLGRVYSGGKRESWC